MHEIKKLSEAEKFTENPFLKEAIEQVNSNLVKKYKSATNTSESAILQAFDKNTGELLGHTQFIRQIEVDEEKFTKMYLSQFSAFWELNKSSIRVFGYIMTELVPKKDMFPFFINKCMKYTGYKNKKQIYEGLAGLVSKNIIARTEYDSWYYINPMIAFNGDRVTFAKTYVKKKPKSVLDNPNQLTIDGEIARIENENN
jgi:hypothetical protein